VSELPSGTVTFLFSDIEGSTRLLQRLGADWADVIGSHNRILREAFAGGGGLEVDRQGDAFFAVFARAREAAEAAVDAQRRLSDETWPDGVELRVRMGLHTGEPAMGEEGYLGLDVVRASRICSAAHGGQILVSETTRALLGREPVDGAVLRDAGRVLLKDIDQPEPVSQLVVPGLPESFPPPRGAAEPGPAGLPDLPFAGHELELAEGARRARDELALDSVDEIGPTVARYVEEALRSAAAGAPLAPARRRRWSPGRLALIVAALLLVGVPIAYLVANAL
jgi:class 3 adenylate cyclase